MSQFFWKIVGEKKPEPNAERRLAFKKAFQRLWVAGTLGAFFFAFARNLPMDFREMTYPFDIRYTTDRFIRYGYLLWLLTYFFVSALNNDESKEDPDWRHITYDVLQSALSLVAAFLMGFILPDQRYELCAYMLTSFAIFLICSLSLWWFFSNNEIGINRLRKAGAIVAIVPLPLLLVSSSQVFVLLIFGISQLSLWVILLAYIRIRIDK